MTTTTLFWHGDLQAVELPKAFQFQGDKVNIYKKGKQVIIEPVADEWAWIDELSPPDPSWEKAIEELRADPISERDWGALK
ncbi:Virulence-associated protein and related proteins [Moraxella lacunata]|uniref:Virulence-associated protein and related proteins n=1 Tax=Moraxella lacunata TaxID=477 RepID=A0A378TR35_MORLA|nr:AbrB/MazE/SpoVT family DNA-binding domain-containing protein [Moraxella lacunata]STZ63187.1 Virulence-associated protein and related proteins [Moraxella lacunata]